MDPESTVDFVSSPLIEQLLGALRWDEDPHPAPSDLLGKLAPAPWGARQAPEGGAPLGLCESVLGAPLTWLRGIRVNKMFPSASFLGQGGLCRELVCSPRLPCSEKHKACVGVGGSLRNAKPQKNGEKQQGGVGGSLEPGTESWGWAVRNLGWGESGRGCGKQLVWPSSQWGDGARLVSSPESRGPARGHQASPSSPPAPLAGWSAARERQAEPSKQPGSGGERTQSTHRLPGTCQQGLAQWLAGWRPSDLAWGELPLGWGLSGSDHLPPLTKLFTGAFDLKRKIHSHNHYQMLGVPWWIVFDKRLHNHLQQVYDFPPWIYL